MLHKNSATWTRFFLTHADGPAVPIPSNKIVSHEVKDSEAPLEPPYRKKKKETNFLDNAVSLLIVRLSAGGLVMLGAPGETASRFRGPRALETSRKRMKMQPWGVQWIE